MSGPEWVDIHWTDAALDAAIEAQRVRMLSFSGMVVHPNLYTDLTRWAMADAIAAAQEKQEEA